MAVTRIFSALRVLTLVSLLALLVLLAFLVWPYLSVWRLNQAALSADPADLSEMVDLSSIRLAIKQKLDKDVQTPLGDFSDGFVQWLERGFRTEGQGAVDRLVTIDWVRDRLLEQSMPGEGFLPRISYAFFDEPTAFRLRLGAADQRPIQVRLQPAGLFWQVTALYH